MENGEALPYSECKDYGFSGRIMLGAMVAFFIIVIVVVCLHLSVRWYLLRAHRRRQRRRSRLVFTMDNAAAPGLDAAVMKSLPVFTFSSKTHPEPMDCSVCLCEFEENEAGRVLPKCNHRFHAECIDMWFHSHSTCPLCRTPVEAAEPPESSGEAFISICQESLTNEPGSSSGSCSDCKHPSSSLGTSSFGARRKPFELTSLDIPRPDEGCRRFESESNPPTTQPRQSPISRVLSLSFKRILGREQQGGVPPAGNAATSSPAAAPDVDNTKFYTTQRIYY